MSLLPVSWALFQYPTIRVYCYFLQSLEAARFVFRIVRSLWNLIGTSAAVLLKCLSNYKAMPKFKLPISRLRDLRSSYDKTSYRILKQGLVLLMSQVITVCDRQKYNTTLRELCMLDPAKFCWDWEYMLLWLLAVDDLVAGITEMPRRHCVSYNWATPVP